MKRTLIISLLLVLLLSVVAAQPPQRTEQGRPQAQRESSARDVPSSAPTAPAEERLSSTSHVVRIDGREVRYTATAGTLPLKDAKGKATAGVFFVAYTRDSEQSPRARPVTFCFNGGPGAATIWLHMGSFGPRRVQMAEDGFQPAPPFELVENEFSLVSGQWGVGGGQLRQPDSFGPIRFVGTSSKADRLEACPTLPMHLSHATKT